MVVVAGNGDGDDVGDGVDGGYRSDDDGGGDGARWWWLQ